MNLRERLVIEFGDDCFAGVRPELDMENEFRVSALWNQLEQHLGAELPARSRPTVIRTTRAFPHTRWTSRSVTVVLDQHLVDVFTDMTRPMVMPSCPQELATAYMALGLAERLQLAGRHPVADFFGGIFNAAQATFQDLVELQRGAWQQGDMLVRGQWHFTVAHELVHALLHQEGFTERLGDELKAIEADLVMEVGRSTQLTPETTLEVAPLLDLFAYAHQTPRDDRLGTATALTQALAERLSDPRFRQEVICDWLAARATAVQMLHWVPLQVGLATCGLSLIHLATIKQLDSYARESSGRSRDHLGEGALRLVVLRSLLCLRPPAGASSEQVSRAFGEVTSAYLETYAAALRTNWRSAIAEAEHHSRWGMRSQPPG